MIEIYRATENDIIELQSISKQTFLETFAAQNTVENMQKYLAESFSIAKLTTEISNPNSEFYFAKLENTTIGYLKINFEQAQSKLNDSSSLEIERIYVLKEFHGKGVGQLLYEKAVQVGLQNNFQYIWLGVWEENLRAINFYKKNGFVQFDKYIFMLGDDEQRDILMKLELNK